MNVCPTPSSDENFRKLYHLLGGDQTSKVARDTALKSAYRMWRIHEDLGANEGSVRAMETISRTPTEKIAAIQAYAANLRLDKDTHTYTWNGDPTIQIQSVSSLLDDLLEKPYYEGSQNKLFSESGTAIHDLFNQLVTVGEITDNIKKYADDRKIPYSLVESLDKLKDKLKGMGTLVSEQTLYTEGTMEDMRIAGTADVIIYGADGKKYIVDIKTVYNTDAVKKKGGSAWDPLGNNGQKAKRYTAQTMAYGRMTEWADRQPVTDHFIVPIELELNDDKDLSQGYKSAKMHDMLSVNEWQMNDYATRLLDKAFGISSTPPATSAAIGVDDSSKIYQQLTGDIGVELNPEDTARKVSRGTRTVQGRVTYGYFEPGNNKFHPFNNQTDPKEQLQQIVRDYVNRKGRMNADLSIGIRNYLMEGDKKYLKMVGDNTGSLTKLLGQFIRRTDINVQNLDELPGFEDKKNWILIEDGIHRHLFYISAENMSRKFDTQKTGFLSSNSLFGKIAPELRTDHTINSSLKNNIGDARAFEGTLIAMKLKEANPNIRFGMTMVHGISGSGYSNFIDLKENLETLQNLVNDPVFRKSSIITPALLKLTANKDLMNYANYRPDFLEMLGKYMDFRRDDNTVEPDLLELTDNLRELHAANQEANRKEMLAAVAEYLNNHVRMGRDANTDYDTYLLSAYYAQMQDMDISLLPIGMYRKWAGLPQNITNPMLQKVNKQLNSAVNKMSQGFYDEYKTQFTDVLKKYLQSKGIVDASIDVLTGNTARHYEELFQTMTREVHGEDGSKRKVTVPSFTLKAEDSPEFKALSPQAQQMIRSMNDIIMKFAERNEIKWVRGRVPLVRATTANRLMNAKRTDGMKAYGKLVDTMLLDLEASFGTGDDADPISDNIFRSQRNDAISDRREELMGMQSDGFLNLDDYQKWSTDVESIMDVFVIQGLKHETLNEVGGTMRAVNTIFQWYASNLMEQRLGLNIDWVNHMKTINLDSRDIDAGTAANRFARAMTRLSSIGLYAFNPLTAATSWMGNEFTTFSESIANTISKSGRFSTASLVKAKGIIAGIFGKSGFEKLTAQDIDSMEKVNLLMRKFRMFNQDISSLLNGYHKTGDKFLFRSKYMFSMLNAGDYASRMNIMIAQMLEEGSWDAYSVKDGHLVYDENKDKRFNGQGKLTQEQSQALRKVIMRNNGQSTDTFTRMEFGHDEQMGDSIRGISNYLLGTNDREARATMNFVWWGKIFGASKNWLTAKLDRWILGLGNNKIQDSSLIGEYVFEKDPEGNTYAFWKGDHMEGIIVSWLALIDNIRRVKEERVPLTTIQKNNIARSLSDLVLVVSAAAMANAIIDKDKRTKADDTAALVLRRSTDDLLTLYNLATNPKFLWTPVSLEWAGKVMNLTFKGVMQMDPDKLIKATPIANQLDRYWNIMFNEDFEISTE